MCTKICAGGANVAFNRMYAIKEQVARSSGFGSAVNSAFGRVLVFVAAESQPTPLSTIKKPQIPQSGTGCSLLPFEG
jgi:hypothetical protein